MKQLSLFLPLFAVTLSLAAEKTPSPKIEGNQLLNLFGVDAKDRVPTVAPDTWPATPGEALVCPWKDDKTGAISYTIDDNCAPDVDWWLKEAGSRGIPLTWFLITDRVGGPAAGFNGTWALWQRALAAGHGVESHSSTHLSGRDLFYRFGPPTGEKDKRKPYPGIEWDYVEAQKQIAAGMPGHRANFIAYPGGGNKALNDVAIASKYYLGGRGTKGTCNPASGIDYLNTNAMSGGSVDGESFNGFRTVLEKQLYNGRFYGGWVILLCHKLQLTDAEAGGKSMPAADDEDAGKSKGAPAEEVVKRGAHARTGPEEIVLLDFYTRNKEKLWAGNFGDVARYGQERETARLTSKLEAKGIVLSLSDRMDDRFYDFPLTIKVRIPDGWKSAAAAQATKPVACRIVKHNEANYALVSVVPDKGEAVLKQAE